MDNNRKKFSIWGTNFLCPKKLVPLKKWNEPDYENDKIKKSAQKNENEKTGQSLCFSKFTFIKNNKKSSNGKHCAR